MKKLRKIMTRLILSLVVLTVLLGFILIRPNLPIEALEETYFTEYSHYQDLTIQTLEGENIDIKIHYQDRGNEEDPVIVLLHGAFSSSHTFIPWANVLVEAGYRVILPDLPYFGLSGGFDDKVTSYRRSAATVKSLLDVLAIDTIDIAGNSLGGAVSWFFASEYPDRVKTLTLIDAMVPYMEQGERESIQSLTQFEWLVDILSQLTPDFLVRALLETAYGNPQILTDDVFLRYYNLLLKEGTRKAILTSIQEEEPSINYQDRLESLMMPVFMMWGEKDTWISPSYMDYFKETINIPEEHIVIYSNVGHLPMEENPLESVEDYLLFIEE